MSDPLLRALIRPEAALAKRLAVRLEIAARRREHGAAFEDTIAGDLRRAMLGIMPIADDITRAGYAGEQRKNLADFIAARLEWVRTRALAMAKRISATQRRILARIIADAAERGANPRAIEREIAERLGGRNARRRAAVIARTELHHAASYAQMQTARADAAEGVDLVKIWRANNDSRTRPAHRKASGQVRDLAKPFSVGGQAMDRPGDPNGGPGNTINCRCTVQIVPRRLASRYSSGYRAERV